MSETTAEQISAAARKHCEQVILPEVAAWEASMRYPRKQTVIAGADGLLGLYCPPEHGGQGLSFAEAIPVFEELGRGAGLYSFSLSMHNIVAYAVSGFGQPAFRDALEGTPHVRRGAGQLRTY